MAQVRLAVVGDAERIARIHVMSWQATYSGIFAAEFLAGLSITSRQVWWSRRLSTPVERSEVLVVESTGRVVGFSSVGPSNDLAGEVYAIYLAPKHFRKGLGSDLMRASEASLISAGFDQAILWVVDANQRARHFYEAMGWKPDGAMKLEDIGGVQVNEIRYCKELDGPGAAPS